MDTRVDRLVLERAEVWKPHRPQRRGRDALYAPDDVEAGGFLSLLNAWAELTTVLNELSCSMGEIDFNPFFVAPVVAHKLQFVHLVVRSGAGR